MARDHADGVAANEEFGIRSLRVFTIESGEAGWMAVREAISAIPNVRVAGTARRHDDALVQASAARPDAVVAAWRIEGRSTIPLLRSLRHMLPHARFTILADGYDRDELLGLSDAGISGYLLWKHLTDQHIHAMLSIAIGASVAIVSDDVADAYVDTRRDPRQRTGAVTVTERQRAVLRHLGEEMTQENIARP